MITLYGISNCNSVKKARYWLDQKCLVYQFHDFRSNGIDLQQITQWCQQCGWSTVLNQRSTTWRHLPDDIKNAVNADNVATLLLAHPTLIKRPVLVYKNKTHMGFSEAEYQKIFA